MTKRIVLAIFHGMGSQPADFADEMTSKLRSRFADKIKADQPVDPEEELVVKGVHWAPVFQTIQDDLWTRLEASGSLDFKRLRKFIVHALGDATAYQISRKDRTRYDQVHVEVAKAFRDLAVTDGGTAPLCIAAHSLGSMIASNYMWDLQKSIVPQAVLDELGVAGMDQTSLLEQGLTFRKFFTYGTTIPIWNLRYKNFGEPISIPPTGELPPYDALSHGWWNFYDEDDILGYPVKGLNNLYGAVVTEDKEVNVGSFWSNWSPLSHTKYDTDKHVLEPIALELAVLWKEYNGFP